MKRKAEDISAEGECTSLELLKKWTVVVADTGDFNQIKQFQPEDATTNPSLIVLAAKLPEYSNIIDSAIEYGKKTGADGDALLEVVLDKLAVNFGAEILKVIPGRVSTEVDAHLSFDTEGSCAKARKLIKLYEDAGVSKDRVLIKMATTWEGCRAAEILQKEGINCNMTLLFSFAQAIAAAEAGAFLVSPFVGRILDWYKKNDPSKVEKESDPDPGVHFVSRVFSYYRKHNYPTIVMGASFRNTHEICHLAGCDKLTISPKLLQELTDSKKVFPRKLFADGDNSGDDEKIHLDEKAFRWMLNEDRMATEKLAEGIRLFNQALEELKTVVQKKLSA